MTIMIIAALFLLIGYLSGSYKDRFLFLKASVTFVLMLGLAFIAILLAMAVNYLVVIRLLGQRTDVFTFGLLVVLLGGVFNFYLMRWVLKFKRHDSTLIELEEYYIQWTTIFFTLYQFFTASSANMMTLRRFSISAQVLNVDVLNIIILPVLLVSWISLAMTKVYLRDHHQGSRR